MTSLLNCLGSTEKNKLADEIKQVPFITLTSDGSTDSSVIKQEMKPKLKHLYN